MAKRRSSAKRSDASGEPTPMMAQYFALKDQAPDCLLFYRMGDFFELFFDDARAAAETLDIALTSRGEHLGAPVPMCGVPVHAAEAYLARLIRGGHRVAIAEQVETPAEAKARGGSKTLVARDIVRLVTAGTLTEDALLDARSSNWLVAIAEASGGLALAAADISTGAFEAGEIGAGEIEAELARLAPSEVILAEGSALTEAVDIALRCIRPAANFDSLRGEAALQSLFGVATLDGFGDFSRAELAAMGGLVAYLDHAGRGAVPLIRPPVQRRRAAHMLIDAATRESLEITRSQSGSRTGSLLACIDRSVTGAGARLLAVDLSAPLMDRGQIEERQALVEWLHDDQGLRVGLRDTLKSLPDIARALGRIAASRGSPRDLGAIRDGLGGARLLRERLALAEARPTLLDALLPAFDGHGALVDTLTRALVPSPPTESQNGGFIAEGYDAALDALRATAGDARRAIAALEAGYRDSTGIASLKIRHNAVLGYHVEVPAKHGDRLMVADSGFTHRQTLAGVVRFNAPELHDEAMKVAQAGGHALAAEQAHLEDLIALVAAARDRITAVADALARLDVAAGHAVRAVEGGWTRPSFVDTPCLEIEGGRHPVVEAALAAQGDRFVANDCFLGATAEVPHRAGTALPEGRKNSRLWLVSGPNMGGKSTFLRQNALIVLLAQAGSYVPASRARLGLVDRLFSRVGASDNLARGRSTFMVEMVETAAILTQATPASFVVLDEVGRGTSTYDGLALAWAVVEAVHDDLHCRCLFATHYHELTRLAERCDALSLHHVRAREWQGDLVLLHELADGPADRSYGLAVAKLAGVPPTVVARAKAVLRKLEAGREKTGGLAAGLDDLPLFAAARAAPEEEAPDLLRAELAALDADALTPREALDLVYRLKTLATEGDA